VPAELGVVHYLGSISEKRSARGGTTGSAAAASLNNWLRNGIFSASRHNGGGGWKPVVMRS